MPIEPQRREEILVERSQRAADQYKDWVKETYASGFAVFGKGAPRERLADFMLYTYPEDLPWILNEHLVDIMFAPVAEGQQPFMLRAQSELQAVKQGLLPPPPDWRTLRWGLLAVVPEAFKVAAHDFQSLLKAEQKRGMQVVA